MPNDKRLGRAADAPTRALASSTSNDEVSPADDHASARADATHPAASGTPKTRPSCVPDLSLPKGGGALKGIGEKIAVNPATGGLSLSIPLPLPKARGVSPPLSLAYGSGGGAGPFGLGWSLDTPRISRKTEKGLPRYGGSEPEDVFILSGAEDLVPVRRLSGGAWVVDARDDGVFRVLRYRPRQEGLYARIEQWRHTATNEVFWLSISKDNVTSRYGVDAASRIADPSDPAKVFAWLLSDTCDDRGDLVRYSYKAEDDAELPACTAEQNRRSGEATAQRYLKRIEYGVDTPSRPDATPAPSFHFEIVVDYGDHDPLSPMPSPSRDWPCRADPFSDFRAGFEVRTRRLAQRILVFHRFAALGAGPVLTAALDFKHQHDRSGARLTAVRIKGYDDQGVASERPPISFAYSVGRPDPAARTLDEPSRRNLPQGVDGARFRFTDLYGEAAPGVLVEEADAWFYKRNEGDGRLGALERVAERPTWAGLESGAQLTQLEADGQLHAVVRGQGGGYAAWDQHDGWSPFRPFAAEATLDWSDPTLRHADLDGDGRAEALLLRDEVIRWFRNGGRAGYAAERRAFTGVEDEAGPARVLQNDLEGVFLADMTGDGLSDIVRVRNGEVCYWPNCGYGRFGARVSMDGAPRFDAPDLFEPARLRLADVDGSGTTDLIYLGRHETRFWINQAGNGWSDAVALGVGFPAHDQLSSVEVADLMGSGTSCLVWSTALPHLASSPLRFLDLTGGVKPNLLTSVDNGAGALTEIEYAASSTFYRADRQLGRPWRTTLPFPVQVVRKLVNSDLVAGGRLVSEYAYRHGYYDRAEREFRGFALVEQRDAETAPQRPTGALPPVLIRTWFHTGAWSSAAVSAALADEYFPAALRLPDSLIEGADTAREHREARRALRGKMLRQEVYGLDGATSAATPYQVTENRYLVRRLQPCGAGETDHGVFAAYPLESLGQHLERDAGDPRLTHELTLDLDAYGNPLRQVSAAYRRRDPARLASPAGADQATPLITVAEAGFAEDIVASNRHRHSVPVWSAAFEATGITPAGEVFGLEELRAKVDAMSGASAFHAVPDGSAQKRLLSATVNLYRTDASADSDPDLDGVLAATPKALGALDPLALPYRAYQLALTDALVAQALGSRPAAQAVDLAADGYEARTFAVQGADGQGLSFDGWWIPSSLESFDPAGFYQATKTQDRFGAVWTIAHDAAWLFPTAVTDPYGGTVSASWDLRRLSPTDVTDANGGRHQAAYDAFGRAVAIAVMGKPGAGEGDSLADPTETYVYAEDEWRTLGRPNYAHAKARETHGDPATRWLETRVYTDGFGRELATKTRARPGLAFKAVGVGQRLEVRADPRWIGTGRTVYDNKGNPLRRYEPYFSTTVEHEEEEALRLWGVSPEMRYDPLGRLVETRFPDLTVARVSRGPWSETHADRNDTLTATQPWDKATTADLVGSRWQRARALAETHAGTATTTHLDPRGRPILAEADNGSFGVYKTRTVLAITGAQREVIDANGNRALAQTHDLAGRPIRTRSNDAGESFALMAADGQPRHSWTARGQYIRHDYDRLRRPTALNVLDLTTGAARVVMRTVYGDSLPGAAAANLVGRPHLVFDDAGAVRLPAYDFKGNPVAEERFLFATPTAIADWTGLASDLLLPAWIATATDFDPPLAVATTFDALNRPVIQTAPDLTETHYGYDLGGRRQSVGVSVLPAASATDAAAVSRAVKDIAYDAMGQRTAIEYGNGVASFYSYDPTTWRPAEILTTTAYQIDVNGDLERLPTQPAPLQWLVYTHDPAGNLVEIEDLAQDKVFNEGVVEPRRRFEYDPLYRLTKATGREHPGQALGAGQARPPPAWPQAIPASADMQALATYAETYAYDPVGNLTNLVHAAANTAASWTRTYRYDYELGTSGTRVFGLNSHPGDSNRLYQTSVGTAAAELFEHDAGGAVLATSAVSAIAWDFAGRPVRMQPGADVAHYRYDGAGQRVRKVVEHPGAVVEERVYLGAFEIYRRFTNGTLHLRRDTLHLYDGTLRVLLVETEKDATGLAAQAPPVPRFQLDDHLGSACLELDGKGLPISYEEYHPYGATALHWANTGLSQKRYRYTGMERDDESGFAYHAARYYLPWLGRWLSADPAGMVDGPCLYAYSAGSPLLRTDRTGKQSVGDKDKDLSSPISIPLPTDIELRPIPEGVFGPQKDTAYPSRSDNPSGVETMVGDAFYFLFSKPFDASKAENWSALGSVVVPEKHLPDFWKDQPDNLKVFGNSILLANDKITEDNFTAVIYSGFKSGTGPDVIVFPENGEISAGLRKSHILGQALSVWKDGNSAAISAKNFNDLKETKDFAPSFGAWEAVWTLGSTVERFVGKGSINITPDPLDKLIHIQIINVTSASSGDIFGFSVAESSPRYPGMSDEEKEYTNVAQIYQLTMTMEQAVKLASDYKEKSTQFNNIRFDGVGR